MPRAQIEKCAKARAIRTAYPDLGGLYILEECEQFNDDSTPSGRHIVVGAPTQGSHEAAQKVLEDKLAGNMPLNPPIDVPSQPESQQPANKAPAKTSGAPTKLPESAYNKENVPPATKQEPWKYNGTVEFDFSEDQTMPYVRGDIAELAGHFPKDLTLRRKNDWFVCFAEDVERIKAVAVEKNFQIKEIPGGKAPQAGKATTAGRGGGKVASEAAVPVVVKGTIESHTEK